MFIWKDWRGKYDFGQYLLILIYYFSFSISFKPNFFSFCLI